MASCDIFRKVQIYNDISLLLRGRMTERKQKIINDLKRELEQINERERTQNERH